MFQQNRTGGLLLKERFQFFWFVDRPDGIDKRRPIELLEQAGNAVQLEKRHQDVGPAEGGKAEG